MFKALIGGVAQVIAKPQVLIAGILAAIVQAVIVYFSLTPLGSIFEKALVLGQLPSEGIFEIPFQFYQMYSSELNVLVLALLASLILQFWLSIVVSRFAHNVQKGRGGIAEALGFGFASFGRIIVAIVFLLVIAALFYIVFQAIVWVSRFSNELSLLLTVLLLIFVGYLYVKLVFFITVMGVKGENVRNALIESWNFSKKKFWIIVILLVIISLITGFIDAIGSLLSDSLEQEIAASAVLGFFSALGATFAALVLANYYLTHETEHPKLFYQGRKRKRK